MQVAFSDIVNPVATLVAAFTGAWFAFIYQNRQKTNEKYRENISAGNRALVTLFQQVNSLKLYQVDMIEPHRNNPSRHIQIQPNLPFQEDSLAFDIKSLDFLITPPSAQIVLDLILEEARYRDAIKAINARSEHHFSVVQPKLASAGIVEGREYSEQVLRSALGELDYLCLQRLTDAVVRHVDRTVGSLVEAKDHLRKVLIERYPKGRFINFEMLHEPQKSIFS